MNRAWARREVVRGIFGIDPAFDRATYPVNFLLLQSQAFAVGNRDLLRNDVNFADRLRNRMFTWMRAFISRK